MINALTAKLPSANWDGIAIDEATLGCDSLARLDVILHVNRFFGLYRSGVEDYLLLQPSLGAWCDLIDQHVDLMDQGPKFSFSTSGSTGTPKPVTFDMATLVEEVQAHLSGPFADQPATGRIIALVPPHHIYGFLFTCLLPSMTGAAVVDLHASAPTSALRRAQSGDLIIATPHIWGLLHQSGQKFGRNVRGVTSAGPSDQTTWDVPATTGLARLTEIFGATETAGIGTRTGTDQPFELLGHLSRDGDKIRRGSKTLPLQDTILWCGTRQFTVAGRLDDVIQVGGVNVSPRHVTGVLEAIPGVKAAVVRPGDTGLRAFIVPAADDPSDPAFHAQIRQAITSQLDPAARPVGLKFGPALQRNRMGKLIDWADPI